MQTAANYRKEPTAEVPRFRCVRAQHEKRCDSIIFNAAVRREERSFVRDASRLYAAIYMLPGQADLRQFHPNYRERPKPTISRQLRYCGAAYHRQSLRKRNLEIVEFTIRRRGLSSPTAIEAQISDV